MKASQWIDRVKVARGLDSDYAVAKSLDVSRANVSKYRSTTPTMDEDLCIKVAHALGIDPAIVLADQAMERAKGDEARSAWQAILQRLGGVAAGFLVAVGLSSAPGPAQAGLNKTPITSTGMHIASSTGEPPPKRRQRRPSHQRAVRQAFSSMARALSRGITMAPA